MEYAATATPYVDFPGFLQRVFGWMCVGLVITAGAALLIGSSDALLTEVTEDPIILAAIFGGQLVLVFVLAAAVERLSVPVAISFFFLYSLLNGVIFAFVFELYTSESIFTTFLVTAGMFAAVAVWGYTTKRDLSGLGTILFMALIGLIIATVVNLFVGGSTLYWITTYAGVVIFAGLTAYDMQKLKRYGAAGFKSRQQEQRRAILGALALYLDFINLFLFLLRIVGRGR